MPHVPEHIYGGWTNLPVGTRSPDVYWDVNNPSGTTTLPMGTSSPGMHVQPGGSTNLPIGFSGTTTAANWLTPTPEDPVNVLRGTFASPAPYGHSTGSVLGDLQANPFIDFVPGVGTAVNWNQMGPYGKAFSLGLDAVDLATFGLGKSGTAPLRQLVSNLPWSSINRADDITISPERVEKATNAVEEMLKSNRMIQESVEDIEDRMAMVGQLKQSQTAERIPVMKDFEITETGERMFPVKPYQDNYPILQGYAHSDTPSLERLIQTGGLEGHQALYGGLYSEEPLLPFLNQNGEIVYLSRNADVDRSIDDMMLSGANWPEIQKPNIDVYGGPFSYPEFGVYTNDKNIWPGTQGYLTAQDEPFSWLSPSSRQRIEYPTHSTLSDPVDIGRELVTRRQSFEDQLQEIRNARARPLPTLKETDPLLADFVQTGKWDTRLEADPSFPVPTSPLIPYPYQLPLQLGIHGLTGVGRGINQRGYPY